MLKSSSYSYSDAYMHVKWTITVVGTRATEELTQITTEQHR